MAAVSAGLLQMVSNYTTGKRWADREARMQAIAVEVGGLRNAALSLAEADEVAFAAVGAAYQLPRASDEERAARDAAVQQALLGAAEPPLTVGDLAARLVEISSELAATGNPNVISDVAVASSTARCVIESAIVNIEINKRSLTDPEAIARLDAAVERLTGSVQAADVVTGTVMGSIRA
jgi:formiminotetrahydrofolate cyclodeaminase